VRGQFHDAGGKVASEGDEQRTHTAWGSKMATWRQSLATLGLAHVAIFRGIRLKTQLLVCHEVAHVAIFWWRVFDLV
jgi:hypothetical protein